MISSDNAEIDFNSERIEELIRFFLSGSVGGNWSNFLIDRFDLKSFFDSEPLSGMELKSVFSFMQKYLQWVSQSQDDLEAFADTFLHLRDSLPGPLKWSIHYALAQSGIGWARFRNALSDEKKLIDFFGCENLRRAAPQILAEALSLTTLEITHVVVSFSESIQVESVETNCDRGDAKEFLILRTIVNQLANNSPDFDFIAKNVDNLPVSVTLLVGDYVLNSGSKEEIDFWLSLLRDSGKLTTQIISTLLNKARGNAQILSEYAENILLDFIQLEALSKSQDRKKVFEWVLEFALETRSISLLTRLREIFWAVDDVHSPYGFSLIIKSYALTESLESLSSILSKKNWLNFADFLSFELIERVSRRNKVTSLLAASKSALESAYAHPEASFDFGVLLLALLSNRKSGNPSEAFVSSLQKSVENHLSEYYIRLSKSRIFRRDLIRIVARVAVFRPQFYKSQIQYWSNSFPTLGSLGTLLPDLQILPSLVDSNKRLETVGAHTVEFEALWSALTKSNFLRDESWLSTMLDLLLMLDSSGVALDAQEVSDFLTSIWRMDTPESLKIERTKAVFSLKGTNRSQVLHLSILRLSVEPALSSKVRLIRDLGAEAGVEISPTSHSRVVSTEIVEGTYEDREDIQGPDIATWQSLAIILDDVIHEVNQPLAAIGNSLVEMKYTLQDKGFADEELPVLRRLENSLIALSQRIEEYKTMAQALSTPALVNLSELVQAVVGELSIFATDRGVKLDLLQRGLKGSVQVYCEPFRLRLALRNLIRNGIQAAETSSRRQVTLNLFSPNNISDEVILQVTDSGAGIPKDLQEIIFERGLTTKPGRGLGLGLSLTSSVVREMGGRIVLENTGPKGSTFMVSLPAFAAKSQSLDDTEASRERG